MDIAYIKDLVTVLVAAVGVPGGLLTATKAVNEMRRGRHENARQTEEKAKENRLRQAIAARDALSQVFNSLSPRQHCRWWTGQVGSILTASMNL